MNCDDFLIRMHECIDDRLPFESDLQLQEHARQCPACCRQWTAWLRISTVLSPTNFDEQNLAGQTLSRPRTFTKSLAGVGVGLAVAAVIMSVFVAKNPNEIDSVHEPLLQHASSVTGIMPSIELESPVDAATWWHDVQQRDWLAQTMPTVRRVRDGVAPLGRSILQAVAILTIGGGERTS